MKKHRIGALLAAGALTLTFAGTALGADPVWATVTGHAEGTSANNNPDEWGEDCTKLDSGLGSTYVLTADYALVIVKAGSEASAPGFVNTLFANASAGETVWADSNGNGEYDEGDKGISHIIFCNPVTTTTTSTTDTSTTSTQTTTSSTVSTETTETTSTSSVETETTGSVSETTSTVDTETTGSVSETSKSKAEKTPPSTDAIGSGDSGTPGGSLWALLVGAAGVLAGVLLLTPRGSRSRS